MKDFESLLVDWTVEDPFYDRVFGGLKDRTITALLRSREEGCLAGIPFSDKAVQALGIEARWKKESGADIAAGEEIARFRGTPGPIVRLENLIIGLIGKSSGIASAAQRAKKAARGRVHLVSGGWKKHPFLIKEIIREAVTSGGLETRILDQPFLYLDKNYVRIFGGISQALRAVAKDPAPKVIQVRGEFASIDTEAYEAIRNGASVLMVDTGSWEDLDRVLRVIKEEGASPGVKSAFAGGIRTEDIPALTEKGVDILDIGGEILDAPWLELSYDVLREGK